MSSESQPSTGLSPESDLLGGAASQSDAADGAESEVQGPGGEAEAVGEANNQRLAWASPRTGTDTGAGPDERVRRSVRRSWRKLVCAGMMPGPRSGAASIVYGTKLYIFGGYGGESRLGDFYQYCFLSRCWSVVMTTGEICPGPRENNGFVSFGSCLYLFGGYDGVRWLNDTWEFNTVTGKWRLLFVKGETPRSRFGCASVTSNNKMLIFGGYDGTTWLNDLFELDYTTETWKLITDVEGDIPSKRSCPSWVQRDDSIFLFGGFDGVNRKNDLFEYKILEKRWVEITTSDNKPSGRYFHASGIFRDHLYVFGGFNGTMRLSCLHSFSFKTGKWEQVKTAGEVPCGRSSLVSQVYGNSFFIFGGYDGRSVLSDFYEYPFLCVHIEPPRIKADLTELIDHEKYSDVTFLVEGREVRAVRALLAIRSEHFRALLFGGMRESSEIGEQQPIVIPDVQYDVFMAVMEFLYTDSVSIQPDLAAPLLVAAEKYLLRRLKSLCEEVIFKSISYDNAVQILLQAYLHNATSLKLISFDFIVDNIALLKGRPQFQLLKQEPELLMEIIMRTTTLQGASSNSIQAFYENSANQSDQSSFDLE